MLLKKCTDVLMKLFGNPYVMMFFWRTGHLFTWKSSFGRESCSNAAKLGFATLNLCQLFDKNFLVGALVLSF
jgi:hypothetical protein